jgi:DNA-binding NtrC family response regulator
VKRAPNVLVAEDEPMARESLKGLLEADGYQVTAVASGDEAEAQLSRSIFDGALLDIRMPGKDGLSVLRNLQSHPDPPAVLIMTAFGSSAATIEAMVLGAYDYLTKPIQWPELRMQLRRAIENRRTAKELEAQRTHQPEPPSSRMAGSSPAMQRLYKLIGQVAPSDSTVLITGESGTGKELVASAIHEHSPRRSRRLVNVNCAAIPDTLLEAELFGHEKGAFTGAAARRIGKLEFAEGGTVFLDEVGELSPATQVKLLRFLQERTVERLGSNLAMPLDVRTIAATNRDLRSMVQAGTFREDLYFRLNVVTVPVPPLRDRSEDIPELASFLLRRICARLGFSTPPIAPEVFPLITSRNWPGNVRELEHALERVVILSRGKLISAQHLDEAEDSFRSADVSLEDGLHEAVRKLERRMIEKALAESGGNRTRAAELLKIHRRLLYDKLREHGME